MYIWYVMYSIMMFCNFKVVVNLCAKLNFEYEISYGIHMNAFYIRKFHDFFIFWFNLLFNEEKTIKLEIWKKFI